MRAHPFLVKAGVSGAAVLSFLLFFASAGPAVQAQNRKDFSIVSEDGHVALGLAIRKLGVSGTFLQAPAHPDDETNALFAAFGYGMGLRVIDLQNNRGEGGQNEIGPELFRDMGVLRTAELLAAHRIDGAEQYFTRAIDYGYSFDPNEVIAKWGRDEIVGDYVRLFRELRPDVVVTMNIQGSGGDRAHEATTVLVREAYGLAGDPTKYPEQLREGLRPWQPAKLYFAGTGIGGGRGRGAAAAPGAHVDRIDTAAYDPLLGRTYQEIGTDARSSHKCQGVGGLPPIPGVGGGRGGGGRGAGRGAGGPGGAAGSPYTLVATSIAGEIEKPGGLLFDDIDVTIAGLARYAGPNPPAALTRALAAIGDDAARARQAFASGGDAATAAPIEAGLTAVRALREQLPSLGLDDAARYEIDFRLAHKERDYEDAVLAAHGLTFQAIANDGLVVAGQPIGVAAVAENRGATDISVDTVTIAGIDHPTACAPETVRTNGSFACASTGAVPADAKLTDPYFTDTYWKDPSSPARSAFDPSVPFGVPFAPTPFHATFHVKAGGVDVTKDVPVQFRYVKDIYFGDKRMELSVVPAFSVAITPTLAIVPTRTGAARPVPRDVFVSVTNGTKGPAKTSVSLEIPTGWTVSPATAPVTFTAEDESLSAHFVVTPPAAVKVGTYAFKAVVTADVTGTEKFSQGYQTIEYPHIERRQVIKPAETTVKVLDVVVAPGLKVGYIMGVGDQVPPAITELGAQLTFLEPNDLAFGDLLKYDVILTGVRAYERRADLRAYNRRLLDYVNAGGTMIVQYDKTEFNQGGVGYGPYPALVSNNRITDEHAPVTVLAPSDPIFTFPNRIGDAAWANWTQERGLYFLGQKDPRYVDLVSMTDPFPDNPGEKRGALVETRYGKGRWLYVGLGLWRQLPAGTPGAYQILANLLSLPKAPKTGQ